MAWFPRHQNMRLDPRGIFPAAKSVLMLGVVYRDPEYEETLARADRKISRYACGRDYHKVLRKQGKGLLAAIREFLPQAQGRVTVDSAPVPEKILARRAGLGWQGKHTNLIHPRHGSYFFLSALLLDIELEVDGEQTDLCGNCRLCLDACPTQALEAYKIDARRCISYLTIEHQGPIDPSFVGEPLRNWVFGCDICQEVCPYNRSPRGRRNETRLDDFRARPGVREALNGPGPRDEGEWDELRRGSPLGRIDLEKWRTNCAAAGEGG